MNPVPRAGAGGGGPGLDFVKTAPMERH